MVGSRTLVHFAERTPAQDCPKLGQALSALPAAHPEDLRNAVHAVQASRLGAQGGAAPRPVCAAYHCALLLLPAVIPAALLAPVRLWKPQSALLAVFLNAYCTASLDLSCQPSAVGARHAQLDVQATQWIIHFSGYILCSLTYIVVHWVLDGSACWGRDI